MENEKLLKLQAELTKIAEITDKFMSERRLRYSVAYGSAIGAVRHGGFIPWDDDFDIMMPYEDYLEFEKAWDNKAPQGYLLQKIGGSSRINHAKIRKVNDDGKIAKGIFLDIFPMYKVPVNKLGRARFLFWSIARLVFTRDYAAKNNGSTFNIITRALVALPKKVKKYLLNKSNGIIERYQKSDRFEYADIAAFSTLFDFYDETIFDNLINIKFGDASLKIFGDYDTILKKEYGEYMTLPPENERVCTHAQDYVEDDYES